MHKFVHKTLNVAVISAALSVTVFVSIESAIAETPSENVAPFSIIQSFNSAKSAIGIVFVPEKPRAADAPPSVRPNGINLDMIVMPKQGNGVCDVVQGKRDSCMATVYVSYADGTQRNSVGVFIGHSLIATDYELVTGHDDTHAVKPDDGHVYTVALSNGVVHKAQPWAFVPGTVAILKMQ